MLTPVLLATLHYYRLVKVYYATFIYYGVKQQTVVGLVHHEIVNLNLLNLRLGLILVPDISARNISAWTFHHRDFSTQGFFSARTFRHGYFTVYHGPFGTGTLQHWDILAPGYFSTWTFRHMYILAPCKAIYTFRHKHCDTGAPCAEMSIYHSTVVDTVVYIAENLLKTVKKPPLSK